jgi:Flp pilus assembly pilin Flp
MKILKAKGAIARFRTASGGATAIEYAVIGGIMAVAIVAALATMQADLAVPLGKAGTTIATGTAPQ